MKTAIVYYSQHHGNTKKLLDAIARLGGVTLIDITVTDKVNLSAYDVIGFASGIYYSKFDKRIMSFAQESLPENKKVFAVYTCGRQSDSYISPLKELVKEKKSEFLGVYSCLAYDTYGPFKLVGGLNKNCPDENDIQGAVDFYMRIIK